MQPDASHLLLLLSRERVQIPFPGAEDEAVGLPGCSSCPTAAWAAVPSSRRGTLQGWRPKGSGNASPKGAQFWVFMLVSPAGAIACCLQGSCCEVASVTQCWHPVELKVGMEGHRAF